jgi:hypothetical protein
VTIHLERSNCQQHVKKGYVTKEETTPDYLAMMPCGLGAPPLIQACCQHSALRLHQLSHDNSPWTSGQSVTHPAVHHCSCLTRRLITTQQPGSTSQSTTLGKPISGHQINSLTPELNHSEQGCLPEFFYWGFKF